MTRLKGRGKSYDDESRPSRRASPMPTVTVKTRAHPVTYTMPTAVALIGCCPDTDSTQVSVEAVAAPTSARRYPARTFFQAGFPRSSRPTQLRAERISNTRISTPTGYTVAMRAAPSRLITAPSVLGETS